MSNVNISYRVMPAEVENEYKNLSIEVLVSKQERREAQLTDYLAKVANPHTTIQECHDLVRCIMWTKQDINAIAWALKARKA